MTKSIIQNRCSDLFRLMKQSRVQYFLILDPYNVKYHTGFEGSGPNSQDGMVLATREKIHLITDSRYEEIAEALDNEVLEVHISSYDKRARKILKEILRAENATSLYIENTASICTFQNLEKYLKPALVKTKRSLSNQIRATKDYDELKNMRKAAEITERAFKEITQYIRPGISEKALSWKLEELLRKLGSQKMAFEPIIASGTGSSIPHYKTSNKRLKRDEMILIDFGATYCDYCCDVTRMVYIGKPDRNYKKKYRIVERVKKRLEKEISIGMKWKNVHLTAQKLFERSRIRSGLIHAIGHGVGLEVHEQPFLGLGKSADQRLKKGMTFALEPGVYFPGWGGIRIEDTYVLTDKGPELLTRSPTSIITL